MRLGRAGSDPIGNAVCGLGRLCEGPEGMRKVLKGNSKGRHGVFQFDTKLAIKRGFRSNFGKSGRRSLELHLEIGRFLRILGHKERIQPDKCQDFADTRRGI